MQSRQEQQNVNKDENACALHQLREDLIRHYIVYIIQYVTFYVD